MPNQPKRHAFVVLSWSINPDISFIADLVSVHATQQSANWAFDQCRRANPSGTYTIETRVLEGA